MSYQLGTPVAIDVNTAIDNPIVAARTGFRIVVFYWDGIAQGAVSLQWKRGGTVLTGPYKLTDGVGVGFGGDQSRALFYTQLDTEPLYLNLSAGVRFGGVLNYEYQPL